MAYGDSPAEANSSKDIQSCLADILKTGETDPAAIVRALEKKGFRIVGEAEEPSLDSEDEPGNRPERNPPEGTGSGTEEMGEHMGLDQIGEGLMRDYMGGDSSAS